MKPKLSPLVLLDFVIINSNFNFIGTNEQVDIQNIAKTYEIDMDYSINKNGEDQLIRVFIKSGINFGPEKKPGYSIFAEGVAIFMISQDVEIPENDKKNLIQFSTVSIAVNSLRSYISNLTAMAPMGRFVFPSIDTMDLLNQKAQKIQELRAKKEAKAK